MKALLTKLWRMLRPAESPQPEAPSRPATPKWDFNRITPDDVLVAIFRHGRLQRNARDFWAQCGSGEREAWAKSAAKCFRLPHETN